MTVVRDAAAPSATSGGKARLAVLARRGRLAADGAVRRPQRVPHLRPLSLTVQADLTVRVVRI